MKPKICRNKFIKTKAKRQMLKTKVMIFEAKLQEIELIIRIILLNMIHLGI